VFVVDREVLSQHFINGSPDSGCGLHASLVEDTKIIQEGTHLWEQVQTFGGHGICGVLVGYELQVFSLGWLKPGGW